MYYNTNVTIFVVRDGMAGPIGRPRSAFQVQGDPSTVVVTYPCRLGTISTPFPDVHIGRHVALCPHQPRPANVGFVPIFVYDFFWIHLTPTLRILSS